MSTSFLSSSLVFSSLLFTLVLALACPAHADSITKVRTAQFSTRGAPPGTVPFGFAVPLDFNTTYPAYSVLATTTINSLTLNKSETPAQLNFTHAIYHVVDSHLEGFDGPQHIVLPTNGSIPATFVDTFGPCSFSFPGDKPITVQAIFFANQVIDVNTTVKVELTDASITTEKGLLVPTATTQYFAIDLPDNVGEVTVLLAASGDHSNETLSSVFRSLTFGCGADGQVVYFTDAHTNASASSTSVKPGKLVLTLEMAEGVPVPKDPSFVLSIQTKERKKDDSKFWKPWVIGVIAGGGAALVIVVLVVVGVVVWMVRRKHDYEYINN